MDFFKRLLSLSSLEEALQMLSVSSLPSSTPHRSSYGAQKKWSKPAMSHLGSFKPCFSSFSPLFFFPLLILTLFYLVLFLLLF